MSSAVQPAAALISAGCGLPQSNQLYAIIRPENTIAAQRRSEHIPATRAGRGGDTPTSQWDNLA